MYFVGAIHANMCMQPNTFSGIASEAVSVCIGTLMTASKGISAQKSMVHGTLFLVRHFLILRKEIAPFGMFRALCSMGTVGVRI